MGSNLSKLKYFTDHFFRKVSMLSMICNYFLLGAAVSANPIKKKKKKTQKCQETLGARHLRPPPIATYPHIGRPH